MEEYEGGDEGDQKEYAQTPRVDRGRSNVYKVYEGGNVN